MTALACSSATPLCSVRQDRDGCWHTVCDIDGGVSMRSPVPRIADGLGQLVELVYSRVDADGSLREARVAPAA